MLFVMRGTIIRNESLLLICSVCGYACVLNMELRRHMMRHTGVRPYKCRVCDRRFGDFGSRQKHERQVWGYWGGFETVLTLVT